MSSVADIVELQEERSKRVPLTDNEFATAGAMLKAAREAAGCSLEDVHEATNVRPDYLESIEMMDIKSLPIPAYTSGFVKAYAQFLELPYEALVTRFRKEAGYETSPIAPELPVAPKNDLAGGRELSLLAVVGILFFVIWVAYQITRPPQDTGPVEVQGTPLQQRPINEPEISYTAENELPAIPSDTTAPIEEASANTIDLMINEPEQPASNEERRAAEIEPAPQQPRETAPDTEDIVTDGVADTAGDVTALENVDFETDANDVSAAGLLSAPADEYVEDAEIGAEALQEQFLSDVEQPTILPERDDALAGSEAIVDPTPTPVTQPVITEPVRVRMISPIYPARCQRRATELERVVVNFDVNSAGKPINQRVARTTNSCFNNATLNAVDRWSFQPATRNGVPVPSFGRSAEFSFKLPE